MSVNKKKPKKPITRICFLCGAAIEAEEPEWIKTHRGALITCTDHALRKK